MRHSFLLIPALLFAAALFAADPPKTMDPDPELAYAEKTLKDANVAADGPALVAFFKARTLTPAAQEKLAAAVKKLGDDSYDVREQASADLIAAGRLAFAYLKPAVSSPDPEVAMRAQRCLDEIERVPEGSLVPAAARMIASKHPEGATEAMLGCLPWLDDESYFDDLFQALARTALKDGTPAAEITAAVKDKHAARRAAAAYVLGRGNPEARKAAAALLADDDVRVRYHAAIGLVRSGEKDGVKPLLALLTDAPPALAWQAEDLLTRMAGDKGPTASVGGGSEAERKKAREEWTKWWADNAEKIDLAKVDLEEPAQRLNLVIESEGKIWECGPDKTSRWSFQCQGQPLDARMLPGGRILVAEHSGGRVSERDLKGNVLWEYKCQNPVVCQRLPNGNTFLATYQEIIEVTPDKKVAFSQRTNNGMIFHAEKMRDGHIVYVTGSNQVVELDASGKELKKVNTQAGGNTGGWASAERLANGNYLVALYSSGKVVELDEKGKVVWSVNSPSPGHATRLRNGNTLVASIEGRALYEYDRTGKEIWTVQAPGRPFHAWRR
jgi:HEAT repeat protein